MKSASKIISIGQDEGLLAPPAAAQYEGPGFSACMAYGEMELMQDNTIRSVVFINDRDTQIEKYTRKVGSQFVSSVLTGKATIERNSGKAQAIRYLCLLADEKTPVFFHATEDRQ